LISGIRKFGVEILAALALICAIMNHNRGDAGDQLVMKADALGYYAYLPAVFIYHDATFSFKDYYEKTYYTPNDFSEFRNKQKDRYVDKYFCGVAILESPFFLAAHCIALIFNLPADGYSHVYQWALIFAAVFYLYLGFKALHKLLLQFYNRPWIILFVLCIIYFGTNLFHYSTRDPAMSHVYSFSLSCIMALSLYQLCFNPQHKWLIISMFSFGLIIAIRPVNIIMIGLFPVMAGSWKRIGMAINYAFNDLKYLLGGILILIFPLLIQSLLWYWQTGQFIVYSYGEEGFNWSKPEIINILFSYNKGWFLYTPIAFIGLTGIVVSFRFNRFRTISALIYMALVIYVLSSWWNWWYGYGFGQRAFIDFLVIPALGLTFLFKISQNLFLKIFLFTISIAAIAINQVQDLQYRHYILRWGNMDRAAYWKVFLKTSEKYNGIIWNDIDALRKKETKGIRVSYKNDFEDKQSQSRDNILETNLAKNGKYAAEINDKTHICPLRKEELMDCDTSVQASVWFYGKPPVNSVLAIKVMDAGKIIFSDSIRLLIFAGHNNTWTEAVIKKRFPGKLPRHPVLDAYISNENTNEELLLDDFQADILSACGGVVR
jgi:hypothetical protein